MSVIRQFVHAAGTDVSIAFLISPYGEPAGITKGPKVSLTHWPARLGASFRASAGVAMGVGPVSAAATPVNPAVIASAVPMTSIKKLMRLISTSSLPLAKNHPVVP